MTPETRRRIYIKLENVSYWLNETKYAQDFKRNKNKPLRQFTACPKSIVIIEQGLKKEDALMYPVLEKAALEICTCHPGVTADDLMDHLERNTQPKIYNQENFNAQP